VSLFGEFQPNIVFDGVTFDYGSDSKFSFKDVSFEVPSGSTLGIAGPSGGGKSTLINLIIGLNIPQRGKVLISGTSPKQAITSFPGKIAYVPQSIPVIQGTLVENILLGRICETKQEKLWLEELLMITGLDLEIKTMSDGLNTKLGEKEVLLSGGQTQKVGLARALYDKPDLIILDEATSSLDAISEHQVSQRVFSANKKSTIIVVAHKMSTLIDCNQIIYLKDGGIQGIGSFASLKKENAEFREQANLSGL
jgi:ATP-binding cassette subfamily C protein